MKQIKNINHSHTLRFKVISYNKITYYFKLHHKDYTIGLYDNDMNLIKTIKGII